MDARILRTTVQAPPPPPPPVAAPPPPLPPPPVPPPARRRQSLATRILIGLGVVVLGVLVAAILAGIVSSLGDEGPSGPAPTAAPTQTAAAPLRTARVAGSFTVAAKLTSVWGLAGKKVGSTDRMTWTFDPRCTKGPCAVTLSFFVEDPGDVLGIGARRIALRLRRSGAVYQGKGTVKLTNCFGTPVPGPMRVRLQVTKGAWVDGVWTATRLRGSLQTSSPEATSEPFVCKASGYTAKLTGARRS